MRASLDGAEPSARRGAAKGDCAAIGPEGETPLAGIDGAVEDPGQGLLMVLDDGEERFALLVDELLSQQQVVVKPLDNAVCKVPGVSGAAVLGDGSVGLILDPGELAALGREPASSGVWA